MRVEERRAMPLRFLAPLIPGTVTWTWSSTPVVSVAGGRGGSARPKLTRQLRRSRPLSLPVFALQAPEPPIRVGSRADGGRTQSDSCQARRLRAGVDGRGDRPLRAQGAEARRAEADAGGRGAREHALRGAHRKAVLRRARLLHHSWPPGR